MRLLKSILANIHRYLLWLIISVMLWAWIFTMITDAPRKKKISVYYNCPGASDAALAKELEKQLPEGIKLIQVYPFSHAAFDTEAPDEADIYILAESDAERLCEYLLPIEASGENDFIKDGVCYGLRIYTCETDAGAAKTYFQYESDKTVPEGAIPTEIPEGAEIPVQYRADENYYICFNADSLHLGEEGAFDGPAFTIAGRILELP